MKNMIASAVLGVAALGANGQTQTQSANTQADVKGRTLSSFLVPMAGGNAQIGMRQQGNTNELSGALTLGDGDIRLRIAGDVSEEQVHALAAIGIKIENGYAIIGRSYARELIAEFDKKLTGNSTFAEIGIINPIARVLRTYIKGDRKDANDTHLKTNVTHTQTVSVVDLLTVKDTATATTYRNTRRTTTIDIDTTTTADFIGGKKNTVTLGAEFQATSTTKIAVAGSRTRAQIPGVDTKKDITGAFAVTEYLPSKKMNITGGFNLPLSRIAAGVEGVLANQFVVSVNGYKDIKGSNRQYGVYANVNYTFGGTPVNPGKMPLTIGDQFTDALRRLDTRSPEAMRDVAGQGRIVNMSSTSEQKRVDETTTENTVEKPPVTPGAPSCTSDDTTNTINCGSLDPATLEMSVDGGTWIVFSSTGHTGNRTVDVRKKANGATPASPATRLTFTETVVVPNTPLVLGSINCTATVIQHGGSTTCQVTANDPQGIVSLRAEIDGVPVTVSVSGNTYSIPVSGLSAGIVAWPLTSQTHILKVYATGKKPDGTPETEQSTLISIQVQCGWVWIPIPGSTGGWFCSI